jgi:hypothetical protein
MDTNKYFIFSSKIIKYKLYKLYKLYNLFSNLYYIIMEKYSNQIKSSFNNIVSCISTNNYILFVLLLLCIYIALSSPKIHSSIVIVFENPVFRLFIIACIINYCDKEPQLALMVAASFLITMHMINKQKVENLSNTPMQPPQTSF